MEPTDVLARSKEIAARIPFESALVIPSIEAKIEEFKLFILSYNTQNPWLPSLISFIEHTRVLDVLLAALSGKTTFPSNIVVMSLFPTEIKHLNDEQFPVGIIRLFFLKALQRCLEDVFPGKKVEVKEQDSKTFQVIVGW